MKNYKDITKEAKASNVGIKYVNMKKYCQLRGWPEDHYDACGLIEKDDVIVINRNIMRYDKEHAMTLAHELQHIHDRRMGVIVEGDRRPSVIMNAEVRAFVRERETLTREEYVEYRKERIENRKEYGLEGIHTNVMRRLFATTEVEFYDLPIM